MKNIISLSVVQMSAKRYPWLGPALWISNFQFFIVQFFVALAWAHPYSWSQNTISDLGNTVCGQYAGVPVCSPLHMNMNVSFILLGLTMIAGSILVYSQLSQSLKARNGLLAGCGCLILSGIGAILVGVFPENTVSSLHIFGAALSFFVGNLGLVILGAVLSVPRSIRLYTAATGIITLAALALLLTHNYLGLGIGGMERLVAYPQTIWFIVFGIYLAVRHPR